MFDEISIKKIYEPHTVRSIKRNEKNKGNKDDKNRSFKNNEETNEELRMKII